MNRPMLEKGSLEKDLIQEEAWRLAARAALHVYDVSVSALNFVTFRIKGHQLVCPRAVLRNS